MVTTTHPAAPYRSRQTVKTSVNLPDGLANEFKRACLEMSDGATRTVHMQDMLGAFMESIVKAVIHHRRVVPDPETLRSVEWTESRVIPFTRPEDKSNDYVRMLTEVLDAGGPKAEAVKMLLKVLTSEAQVVRRKRKPA